jgi:hypothetical protein
VTLERRILHLRLLDVPVLLDVPASNVGLLNPYLPASTAPGPVKLRISVRSAGVGWEVVGRSRTACAPSELPSALLSEVNIGVLAQTGHLAIHAGVVGVGSAGIAIPGPSGAGKSTLTAACLQHGFDYGSDEALCLDVTTALVQPFTRPLALSTDSFRLLGLAAAVPEGAANAERVVCATDLGAQMLGHPLRLRHIVLTARRPGHADLTTAPRTDAVAVLLRHAFNHYRMPRSAFETVHRAVAAAQVWRLSYSDPLEGAAMLRVRLRESP